MSAGGLICTGLIFKMQRDTMLADPSTEPLMHKYLGIPALVVCAITAFFISGGCSRSKPAPASVENHVESYYVLDFQAPDDWKANHSVAVSWRQTKLGFPAVFRLPLKASHPHHFTKTDDGSCALTICGDPVSFDIQPRMKLECAGVVSFLIVPPGATETGSSIALPTGGKMKLVSYLCLTPADNPDTKDLPEAEIEKLLQGPAIEVE